MYVSRSGRVSNMVMLIGDGECARWSFTKERPMVPAPMIAILVGVAMGSKSIAQVV